MFKRKRVLIFLVFISFIAFTLIYPLSGQAQNQVILPPDISIKLPGYSFDPIKKIPEIPQRLRIEGPQEDLAY